MRIHNILPAVLFMLSIVCVSCSHDTSTKRERNLIKAGNAAFAEKNYGKALNTYSDVLDEVPGSEPALFNRSVALHAIGSANQNDTIMSDALASYKQLGERANDHLIKEKANYNVGNIQFNKQDYGTSIEYYKKVLRSDPSNLRARENLRVAQLKQRSDSTSQDQQQQQQDQEQQQDQQQQQQQQQPQQQEMSENAEQILQSMQNRENQTRQETQKAQPTRAHATDKPW